MKSDRETEYFELLDQAIAEPASRAVSEKKLLAQILRVNGVMFEDSEIDPDKLYREIVFGRSGGAESIADHFTVIARPGEAPQSLPREGDLLLRVTLGHPGLGHVAVINDPTLWPAEQFTGAPFSMERQQPGLYVFVSEAGACPHPRSQPFARRILDAEGRMLPYQLLLRPNSAENEIDASPYDAEVLKEKNPPAPFPGMKPQPPITKREEVRDRPHIWVVDERDQPVTEGEYVIHQDGLKESGDLSKGKVYFGKIDPRRPFVFEVRDRVCAIRAGAFFNPDDPKIEYGGTRFDWTLARDDKQADEKFWPYYQKEMDLSLQNERVDMVLGRPIDRFLQHEHITRRPIQIAKPSISSVRIRATPAQIRVGPFVRYADYERAVIWLETVTPCMVRVRYRKVPGGEASCHASTVRVGGHYFAAVEIDHLAEDSFHDYTIELAPLPATGVTPTTQKEFESAFPKLTLPVTTSMKNQLALISLNQNEWLTFRTLRSKYKDQLRFATGSCRWYPGDRKHGKDWGPDMLDVLGGWLHLHRNEKKERWPYFLFFGGDQIYADEIGDEHGKIITQGRFAARIPGPVETTGSVRDKLIDGAWAGRFAHRYRAHHDPNKESFERLRNRLKQLDDFYSQYPDIKGIYREYPDKDPQRQIRGRYETLRNKAENQGAKGEARKYQTALNLLPTIETMAIQYEPLREYLLHWEAGFSPAVRRNPMGHSYLLHNFLLWSIPDFENQLPTLTDRQGGIVVLKSNDRGHPAAEEGKHAADFAEYSYLYEHAWTSRRGVRRALAHVPTFLMFDDHEVTDDWNFDTTWVRMLHNEKDDFKMWPKTMTDALAAYWVYQGWGNKAPSQWNSQDPRVKALADAQRTGIDALPQLRRCIHDACFKPLEDPKVNKDSKKPNFYQSGLSLDWHYRLPFDPPFLVPDCRSRKLLVPADEQIREINHEVATQTPMSQTIDNKQLAWMHKILVEEWRAGPVAFIAPSAPLLLQKNVMDIMMKPETVARAWAQGPDVVSLMAALTGSTKFVIDTTMLLIRVFRKAKDLEHMIRDRSWRDLWGLVSAMRKAGSPVKTLVLVSGDVHHSYCMTANLPGHGRPQPEVLQITCSGLQTTIRSSFEKWLAEKLGAYPFNIGKLRLVPGFMSKNGIGRPSLALFENAVALVDVRMGSEVHVSVTYLAGRKEAGMDRHFYRYSSGASYMKYRDYPGVNLSESQDEVFSEPVYVSANQSEAIGVIGSGGAGRDFSAGWRDRQFDSALPEQSSLGPGQSIIVDGQNVRTYIDAIAWYRARRDILLEQKQAFVKDNYQAPVGLDDLATAANARIAAMQKLGSQPMSDSHVEAMLGWFDAYLKMMYECDRKMEVIAADRFRATQAELEKLKEQAHRLQSQLREVQRSAFRNGNKSRLKESAQAFANMLDSVLVAEQWVRDASTKFDDIRVLGTTLRTQKALHGSPQPWHELMRKITNQKISKLLSVASGLNKALATWQLFDASITLLSGGKTASDRASAGIGFATTVASAGGTLLGASGFFSLYNNLYIGPMVGHILGQIDQLKNLISTTRNRAAIEVGQLDMVNWDLEPGGRAMYEFMHMVMKASSATDLGAIPVGVNRYFSKHREAFEAGMPKQKHGVNSNYARFNDKRYWIFAFRDDIWGMLYGSMRVP